jgi:hypothetical protein
VSGEGRNAIAHRAALGAGLPVSGWRAKKRVGPPEADQCHAMNSYFSRPLTPDPIGTGVHRRINVTHCSKYQRSASDVRDNSAIRQRGE